MFPVHIGSSQPPEFTELSTPVVEQLIERNYTIIKHPLIEAKTDDTVGRAVFDVLFVTTEPARISEYRIELPHQSTQFRSDGVIITTPLGSYGYAHAAGSPILSLGTNVIGVIPIAPFAIRPDHWIVPSDKPLRFDVLRDEHTVSVLTDGEEITQFSRAFSIEITASQSIEIITIHQENQLEKL